MWTNPEVTIERLPSPAYLQRRSAAHGTYWVQTRSGRVVSLQVVETELAGPPRGHRASEGPYFRYRVIFNEPVAGELLVIDHCGEFKVPAHGERGVWMGNFDVANLAYRAPQRRVGDLVICPLSSRVESVVAIRWQNNVGHGSPSGWTAVIQGYGGPEEDLRLAPAAATSASSQP